MQVKNDCLFDIAEFFETDGPISGDNMECQLDATR